MLAILAYLPVLSVGFLADDYVLLYNGRIYGLTGASLVPGPGQVFYRPVSTALTWDLGWALWGFNPWPYHLLGLLLHAATALVLALWLAELTRRPGLGWLAGAIFAVFPLHTEAVGWLAAQCDLWAAFFTVAGLWLFTRWWRRGGATLWLAATLCYGLGVFSKESVFTFLPLYALAALVARPGHGWRTLGRLGLALLPAGLLLGLNVALRLAAWGRLGSYPYVRQNISAFFWDSLVYDSHLLLAPINAAALGPVLMQVVGFLSSAGLLVGLALYGRPQARLLLLAGAWVVLPLLPTLNLTVDAGTLEAGRYLYLAAAGYCIAIAVLVAAAIAAARHRASGRLLLGLALLLGAGLTWAQLQPWQVATAQSAATLTDLRRLIPVQAGKAGIHWYVENAPETYEGAFLLRIWMGWARYFVDGEDPIVLPVPAAVDAPLASAKGDAFALRFRYDAPVAHHVVDYAAGLTGALAPPIAGQTAGPQAAGPDLQLWDFRTCPAAVLAAWEPHHAVATCVPGSGLVLRPTGGDPQLELAELPPGSTAAAHYLRVRVAAQYARAGNAVPRQSQWFWHGPADDYGPERMRTLPIPADGTARVYWAYLPAGDPAAPIAALRFDPVSGTTPATIAWIALDEVP